MNVETAASLGFTPEKRRRRRVFTGRWLRALSGGALLLCLSACSLGPRGVSFEEGAARVEAIPGVRSADFSDTELRQTLSSETILRLRVEADPGKVDPAAFAEEIARVAWAVGDEEPEGGVSIEIITDPQTDFGEALAHSDWDSVTPSNANPALFYLGYIGTSRMLGQWPGQLPEDPSSLSRRSAWIGQRP